MTDKAPVKPRTKLCLVAETRSDPEWCAIVAAALETTAAVTLVLMPPSGASGIAADDARPLVELAQKRDCAALLVDDVATARDVDADGVHLTWRPDIETAYGIARGELGARSIVGVEAGTSRHDAMTLGEAGADYVAFTLASTEETALDAQADLIAWWSDVFVVPAVAFAPGPAEQTARLAQSGADFIALHLPAGLAPDAIEDWARSAVAAIRLEADAA
ncbi:thiamine monophosphate synthase [Hyphomicrobium nitrativorans NL23]|uniref:Thiamine monophosphate synthase n=1 Tax=Hyphomicrobium nitrativorans NL23 TaxID=1029756 RepID=V5SCZ9_9HYPH|nr:thiamine phosphate synthase [Hyphomicrobium nitrativorans]AHB48398.1 thiamine monophosphate synthase [Hyphomicrobium nitrativorans NL23]